MKNRKAQALAVNKIIVLALVFLVVILVLLAVFKLNMVGWLKFLPSFGVQENTKYAETCLVKIAEIKDSMIFFCNQETKVCDNPSKLQVDGEKIQVHYTNPVIPDTTVGQITINLIILFGDVIEGGSKLYSSVTEYLPSHYNLINLNCAYLHSKTEICRDEIMKEEIKYSINEKIGVLGYKKDWYTLGFTGKIEIYTYDPISPSPPQDSEIYISKDNYVMKGSSRIGVRGTDKKIKIYPPELDENYPDIIDENTGLTLGAFLRQLNGAEITPDGIYKKE
jgi:hypothetical protein